MAHNGTPTTTNAMIIKTPAKSELCHSPNQMPPSTARKRTDASTLSILVVVRVANHQANLHAVYVLGDLDLPRSPQL